MTIEAHGATRAIRHLSALDAAIQILTTVRGNTYSADQAFDELLDCSMRHHVDLGDLAEALADIAQGVQAVPDDHRRARGVATQEWGVLLQPGTA
ncbi:ANTAR domain-containing protein [Rhodococcus marinonascens]|uniref:ANTAR domain-containing protein n=1 Tax=Rhodococcus marinonascens TaxID=38311 RepID=UPI000932F3B9|nr:ANTAR domain-containing protein [Rhodococcus marinonascens]